MLKMKTLNSWIIGCLLFASQAVIAQTPTIDPTNCRDGEKVEYCGQHKKLQQMIQQNPAFAQSLLEDEVQRIKDQNAGGSVPKGTIYKIPVVFHVLHSGGIENISDEQIFNQLDILNRDYRLQNADAANVQSDFQGMPADVEIEFVLATIAPNGQCFKGITRTLSAMSYDGADGNAQVDAIVAGNDVYQGQWSGSKYLNIFVCGEIGGAAGYTMKPFAAGFGGETMYNGIWILHDYVGSIGTGSTGTSRALTHEVGHWFNLDHTWGGNNNPGNASSCSTDDAVTDTPNCIGVTSCLLSANTCNSINSYWTYDVRDNVENYMDYSYCSKMFTPGQVTRMRNACTGNTGGRNKLWTTANLTATGANAPLVLCKAEFTSNKTSVCVGDSIEFADDSYNVVTGWSWTFQGGVPAISTAQNPVVTYSTPGLYTVTLTATDGGNSDSETKTSYVRVLPASASLPFLEGFETYTTLAGNESWEVYNPNNNNAWTIESTTGHSGTKCAKVVNFGQAGSNVDELISSPVDLSNVVGSVTLSFRYAYRKKTTADNEWLKVFITNDCGGTWLQRKTLGGSSLSSLTSTSSWKPTTAADWTTVHMINIFSDQWVDNFRYKFRFEGNGGNNMYLDDINIYQGAPSDNLVAAGLAENGLIQDLSLFPNPTENELNIQFSALNAEKAVIQLRDVSGKLIRTEVINAASGSNLAMMSVKELASGTYFMTLTLGDIQQTMQFVVK